MKKIIGITGVATSGKDTLCNLLIEFLKSKNIQAKRLALADKLKEDLFPFVKEKFNINIFDPNPEEKKIIRSVLVGYGMAKRSLSKGTYWTSMIQKQIDDLKENNILPIITDIRYQEYNEDEFFWLKNNNGILIHISRIDLQGIEIPPANSEEEKNDFNLKKQSDFSIKWKTESKMCSLYESNLKKMELIYEKIK
jgi:hypothetical protein